MFWISFLGVCDSRWPKSQLESFPLEKERLHYLQSLVVLESDSSKSSHRIDIKSSKPWVGRIFLLTQITLTPSGDKIVSDCVDWKAACTLRLLARGGPWLKVDNYRKPQQCGCPWPQEARSPRYCSPQAGVSSRVLGLVCLFKSQTNRTAHIRHNLDDSLIGVSRPSMTAYMITHLNGHWPVLESPVNLAAYTDPRHW